MLGTWNTYPKSIQELLVDNVKAELAWRIAAQERVVEDELTNAP